MSEPVSIKIAEALESSLQAISKSAGFYTDLGSSVYRGFLAHAIQSRTASYPLVAIQPATETVTAQREAKNRIETEFRIIVATNDQMTPADDLRRCTADIRKAIALGLADRLSDIGVETAGILASAEFDVAADSPITIAALSATFTFTENYEAS